METYTECPLDGGELVIEEGCLRCLMCAWTPCNEEVEAEEE